MNKERNVLVDMLKGYACLLVVFGHVIMGIRKGGITSPEFFVEIEKFIWTFHVALFMFLSGYVYSLVGGYLSKKTRLNFIKYKFINLAIPYFFFSTIYIIINSFVGSNVNNQFKIKDIFYLWKTPVAQYWFIYALLGLFLIYVFLSKFISNWLITAILATFSLVANVLQISLGSIGLVLGMVIPFGIGVSLKELIIDKAGKSFKYIIILTHIIFVYIILFFKLDNYWIANEIIKVYGITASIALISLVGKVKIVNKFLLFISKYSFSIYLLHTIFTAGLRVILIKLTINNYYIQLVGGLIVGVFIPILIAIIAQKSKVFNVLFYPTSTWKSLRVARNKEGNND